MVVLGGSGAIGGAVARLLRAQQRSVLTTARQPSRSGEHVRYRAGDDSDVDALAERLGSDRLDAAIFCIGASSSKLPLLETDPAEFDALWETNVMSLLHVLARLRARVRRDGTSITALSSDATLTRRATSGPYSATKAALEAVVETLAKEEAQYGVRVNAVAPPLVESPMATNLLARKGVTDPRPYYGALPWGRALTAHEVAQVVVSVALSPEWSYASGQIIRLGALVS